MTTPMPNDAARCPGHRCPSAMNCRRYLATRVRSDSATTAAFYARREPGATACEHFQAVKVVSTFLAGGEGA